MLLHATCITVEGHGVLITGPSGCGKSDLALRLMEGGAQLVSDDQVELEAENSHLVASCPAAIRGLIEARHVGLLRVPFVETCRLFLLLEPGRGERLPEPEKKMLLGIELSCLKLPYFEASTPAKIRFYLQQKERLA